MQQIQAIDLHSPAKSETAASLKFAVKQHGCFYLKISPAEESIFQTVLQNADEMFDGENVDKDRFAVINSPRFTGYSRNSQGQNQIFDGTTEEPEVTNPQFTFDGLKGPGIWPAPEELPTFRPAVKTYSALGTTLCDKLWEAIDEAVLPGINKLYQGEQPQHRLRLLRYAKLEPSADEETGFEPHTDKAEFITLIYQNGAPGLEVLLDGEWVAMPALPGQVVVLIGEPLARVTGECKAGVHRVLRPYTEARTSAAFFMCCPLEISLAQMQQIYGNPKVDRHTKPFGDYMLGLWKRTFPEVTQKYWENS